MYAPSSQPLTLVGMVHWKQASRAIALLGLLWLCQGMPTPRMSFPIGSPDRTVTVFSRQDVGNTTVLLLSDDGDTLFVGARDAVLALSVSRPGVMEMRHKLDLTPSPDEHKKCRERSQKEGDCHNFIRLLQFLNSSHMIACGTYAYKPRCAYISVQPFSVQSETEGKGLCSYSPYRRDTATVVDGELYVGTMANFMETEPAISRYLSRAGRPDMKFESLRGWLEKPTFISSMFIPSEEKVYYFLTEVATEYTFHQKFTVSRIAQVCTSDVGGERILQKRWTTFAKSLLLCSSDGDLPFNIMQDIVMLPSLEGANPDETLFFGVFTSQWSVTSGQSAVCSFRLGDIKTVFSGKYMELTRSTNKWSSKTSEKTATPGTCGMHSHPDNIIVTVKDSFLTEGSVKPRGKALISLEQRYSRIAAQRTKAANGMNYTVLFLLTESGSLHKVVLLSKASHVIEEMQVFVQPQPIKSILLSVDKGVVYVASSQGVFQVPVSNCSLYWSCEECVLARDPFCGWDSTRGSCAEVSSIAGEVYQDVEEGAAVDKCNILHKSRFGSVGATPAERSYYAPINKMVALQCPKASNLAELHWERADGHQLSEDTYLQMTRGSLRFLAAPNTLGRYRCISVENGLRQTLSSVAVVHGASSPSYFERTALAAWLMCLFCWHCVCACWLV